MSPDGAVGPTHGTLAAGVETHEGETRIRGPGRGPGSSGFSTTRRSAGVDHSRYGPIRAGLLGPTRAVKDDGGRVCHACAGRGAPGRGIQTCVRQADRYGADRHLRARRRGRTRTSPVRALVIIAGGCWSCPGGRQARATNCWSQLRAGEAEGDRSRRTRVACAGRPRTWRPALVDRPEIWSGQPTTGLRPRSRGDVWGDGRRTGRRRGDGTDDDAVPGREADRLARGDRG